MRMWILPITVSAFACTTLPLRMLKIEYGVNKQLECIIIVSSRERDNVVSSSTEHLYLHNEFV